MRVLKIIASIILWTISLPLIIVGLLGFSIYSLSNIIYKPEDDNDDYLSGPYKGLPKL